MNKTRFKNLSFSKIKKAFLYFFHYGPILFFNRLSEKSRPEKISFDTWYKKNCVNSSVLKNQTEKKWDNDVLFSIIVPVYNTPEIFLKQMIQSVLDQTYQNWELCIANASPECDEVNRILSHYATVDSRIKIKDLSDNLGISQNTNQALNMVYGNYIALLDHDDLLAPNALFEAAYAIENDSSIDILYSDEDKISTDLSIHFQPNFKPDYSPDLLNSNNYICHLFIVKTQIAQTIGGFRSEYNGAQDYDFILRCIDCSKKVHHIPKILYHWRTHNASTADNPISKMYAYDAGRLAIEDHLTSNGIPGIVTQKKDLGFYRVHYNVISDPLISIVIINNGNIDPNKCINSILSKTTYEHFEIVLVNYPALSSNKVKNLRKVDKRINIKVVDCLEKYSFSNHCNIGTANANGSYLIFIDVNIRIVSPTWLEEMLGICQRSDVGVVGCRINTPKHLVYHAGIIIGSNGTAGYAFNGMPARYSGYMHKADLQVNYSAVSSKCIMVETSLFQKLGGFHFHTSSIYNDVDFCLRATENKYSVVYTPYATMLYNPGEEFNSSQDCPTNLIEEQQLYLKNRFPSIFLSGDPYYNVNLSTELCDYSLK